MDQLRQRLLAAYPDGLSFAPMALRLLRNNFPELDDATVASLKEEMVEDDQCWFFPEQIADAETLKEISQQAEAWLDAYSFFASGALYSRFETRLRHCGRDGQFEKFFDMIRDESMDFSELGSCRFYLRQSATLADIEIFTESLAECVEAEGGEIAEDQLLAENPHLDAPSLAVLCAMGDALVRIDAGGFPGWRSVASSAENLPSDFVEVVTSAVHWLIELDFGASLTNLEMILSVHYGSKFLEEHNLTEQLFQRMVLCHYRGEQKVRWDGRKFTSDHSNLHARRNRRTNTRFQDIGVAIGTTLTFFRDASETCVVADSKNKVRYGNETLPISALANRLTGSTQNGFTCFTYQGETLWDRRMRLEAGRANGV